MRRIVIGLFLASGLFLAFLLVVPAAAQEPAPVCFWSAQGPVCIERPIRMRADGLSGEGLLAALLAGPTEEERERGIWSAIPEGTTLEALDTGDGCTVVVRLEMEPEALRAIDHESFEIIVHQVGWTLTPLEWCDLRIQVRDPSTGTFVSLADFLPEISVPHKEVGPSADEGALASAYVGQSPAFGQGQPRGALTGKTVYISAGHGWEWEYDGRCACYRWKTQRPPYPNSPYVGPIIEDHNNAEAVNQYLLQYLWNAGAMVWPVRERDMNEAEVIVDNDAPGPGTGYFEIGAWTTVEDSGYEGGDYRQAETVAGPPTATAVWTATLPADGEYAVYVWYWPNSSDHAPDVRYTVHHAGGETLVTVDQRYHGSTWHYIGTYGFRGEEEARVTLDNQSGVTGKDVIADAVRFGGGTFDELTSAISTTATYAPDKPWWEIAAFYYVQKMGMDQPPGDVTARPLYARWEHAYTGDDAVYVSWHTNGYSGYQWLYRGTMSIIHNGEGKAITPGSEELRDAIHDELVGDIRKGWDPTWPECKRSMNLGELRELSATNPSNALPGALIEIAYHDHPDDTDALKEPTFNMLAARAVYQGIVKYFAEKDVEDLTLLPEPPTHLAVENVSGGRVRVSWQPSPTDTIGLVGDAATGYRVYTSTDGLGWSNGVTVTATTAYTLTGLSERQLLFVRVAATNEGGESFPTETLGARAGPRTEVLLVNGFDRLNNTMTVPDHDPIEGYNLRVLLDQMNGYDYAIQHGEVLSYSFDSASNEAVSDGLISLGDYKLVDWILGEESVQDETLNVTERGLLGTFLGDGGALFISGAEIGYHLDDLTGDPIFYNSYLRADYAGDDAGTYEVAPASGSIFEGLGSVYFDAPGMYDADYPDQITPANGSVAALTYQGGGGGTAAVQYAYECERLIYFGFPFETIWPEQRAAVMARVLDYLDLCLVPPVSTMITDPTDESAYNFKPDFEGTAEVGKGAVLDLVKVQIQRGGQYWTESGWSVSETWVTAVGTDTWSYPLPGLDEGVYHLRAQAWTTDPYSDAIPAEVTFTYDTSSPTETSLITPTGGITVATDVVTLEWNAVADAGSSISYLVELDGQFYTTTQSSYTHSPIAEGPHTWRVQVFDAAGNRSGWVEGTFAVSRHYVWLPLVMRDFGQEQPPCTDAIVNGGFESGDGWTLNQLAVYNADQVHAGARSMRVGILPGGSGGGAPIFSSVMQVVTLTTGSDATLRLWVYPIGEGGDPGDYHYVGLWDQSNDYHALAHWQSDARAWEQQQHDLSAYAGQMVRLYIGTRNDGDDDTAALYVDDITLEVCP